MERVDGIAALTVKGLSLRDFDTVFDFHGIDSVIAVIVATIICYFLLLSTAINEIHRSECGTLAGL
jgi:hypothetical protein